MDMNKRAKLEAYLIKNGTKKKRSEIADICDVSAGYVTYVVKSLGLPGFRRYDINQAKKSKRVGGRPKVPEYYRLNPNFNYRIITVEEWISILKIEQVNSHD